MIRIAKVLAIESNADFTAILQQLFSNGGRACDTVGIDCAGSLQAGLKLLERECYDAVLLDLALSDCRGLEVLRRVLKQRMHIPVVVLVGIGQDALGIEALAEGAQEYLVKGTLDSRLLERTVRYAIEKSYLIDRIKSMSKQIVGPLTAANYYSSFR